MPLIDDLVRRAEQELKDLKQELETMDITISDMQARKAKKQDEEKAARKLYKSLRNQQPTRPRDKPIMGNGPLGFHNGENLPPGNHLAVKATPPSNGNIPDYDGAVEVLRDEGREFNLTEWAELAGVDRKIARSKLMRLVEAGVVVKTQDGDRNVYDSAKWKAA